MVTDDVVDGQELKRRIARRGLNVREFVPLVAAELGKSVHPSTIEKIITGDRQPSTKLYTAICGALGCDWDDLLLQRNDSVTKAPSSPARRAS
jgi:transcriptional regulator with XRE-family HTH domain